MNGSGTAPAVPRPAYRRLSVEQRRSQLLAAALGLFAQRAPEDVSLDDVATAAEVSRPLVYRYFPGGKQQLYEAALRSAADELEQCFAEPETGPLTQRLGRALDRYLTFVDQHDAGFSALLQGGSVVETSRTTAIVDEVRRAAAEQILLHLGAPEPSPRLRTTVRMWIASVEAASLIWLDENKQPSGTSAVPQALNSSPELSASPPSPGTAGAAPRAALRAELRDWLVDHFVALLTATGARDAGTARVIRAALKLEAHDGPAGDFARRLLPVVSDAAHLL